MKKVRSIFVIFQLLSLCSAYSEGDICGPPTLLNDWENVTATVGGKAILTCPLDTLNSCLVDLVEWYKRDSDPRVTSASRRLLRHKDGIKVFAFDPLMIYLEEVKPEDEGWFTCVVGNTDGRAEQSTYLSVQSSNVAKPLSMKVTVRTMEPIEARVLTTTTEASSTFTEEIYQVSTEQNSFIDNPPIDTSQRRDPSPELINYLSQPQSKSPSVSYSSSRYSGTQSGSGGYAPWYDRSYYDATRVPAPSTTRTPPRLTGWTTQLPPKTTVQERSDQNQNVLKPKPQQAENIGPSRTGSNTNRQTISSSAAGEDDERNRLHLEAINDHLRYIYERIDDLVKRVEKLESFNRV